jgi:hypothetical protein
MLGLQHTSNRAAEATPIHELKRYMRCKDCSGLQGRPYKRSHLVAPAADEDNGAGAGSKFNFRLGALRFIEDCLHGFKKLQPISLQTYPVGALRQRDWQN